MPAARTRWQQPRGRRTGKAFLVFHVLYVDTLLEIFSTSRVLLHGLRSFSLFSDVYIILFAVPKAEFGSFYNTDGQQTDVPRTWH